MAIVNGSLELGYKNTAWFTANPTLVLKEGQIVYLEQTGTFKIGNGVSTLSALSFLGVSSETQTLQNVTDLGSTTTNSITANGFIKSGGTSSQFLKANGSVDSTTYLSTQVVPVGGTTGQILAKVDDTDYNLEWIENYANYTSVLKHTVRAGETLVKGQAVYVSGANGTNIIVSKASNTTEATSSKTMGLIAQNLSTNNNGFVITEGLLDNLNTSTATIGDPVWLGVNGALIYGLVNKPYAPAHLVFIGIVTRVSATVGEIFVKVQNGFELKEIHDVDLITTAPSNNEILTFESSTSLWKPKTVVSALGFTPYNSTNPSAYISGITSGMVTTALGFTPYNSTNPSGYITGITSGMVTTALGYTPYDASNPSGYITSSALSSYVPYTGATANVNLGTRTLTTPTINGVSGLLSFGSTDRVSVGNYATPSSQRMLTVGQDTAWVTIGSVPGATSQGGLWINQATPSSSNAIIVSTASITIIGSIGNLYLKAGGANVTLFTPNNLAFNPIAVGSGAAENFTFTKPNNTGQTASTSIAGFNYVGGTRQWATGNITTQTENVWGATTYSFATSSSTITNAYGNVFNAPIAGTNATITNNWAAQFNGNVDLGSFKINSPLHESTTTLTLNAFGNVVFKSYGATIVTYSTNTFSATPVSTSSGATINFTFNKPNNTNQTASTPIAGWNYIGGTRQWAAGNITTQSENFWGAVVYSFVSSSTITNAYGNVFNAPTAGLNCIITNNFSALFNAPISLTQTVTTETVVQTRTVTIVINGTTYKLLAA